MELVAVHTCRDFLRRDFGDVEHAAVIEPFLEDGFVESLVCLVRTGIENADDFSLEAVRYNNPLRTQHCADVVLSEADGLELPVGRFDVLAPCLPVVVDVVDIKASRLILVVEVEAGNAAAVEHRAACLRELLRPVDVTQCYEVEVCGFQGGGVDDGLELCKECGLSTLHVASRDGEVRGQDARHSGLALCLETEDDLCQLVCKHLRLLLPGEARVRCPVYATVKARNTGHIYALPVVGVDVEHLRLRYNADRIVAIKGCRQHLELLLAVVVRRTAQHDGRGHVGKPPDVVDGRPALAKASVRPHTGLMEDVARNDDKVRPVLLRVHRLKIEATADVLKAGVLAVDLRPGETADVPVAGVQYFQHYIPSLRISLMMSSSLPRRAASARDFAP